MKPFLLRWVVTTVAVFVAAPVAGIQYDSVGCLFAASLLLGIINAFIRPVLLLLSLPLILVTLGVFILIINAVLLKLVGGIIPCFHVPPGFWHPFFGALVISVVSWLLSAFFRGSDGRVYVITHHAQVRQDEIKKARGRVIE
jgi:putative membrane protein